MTDSTPTLHQACLKTLDRFMDALNAHDAAAMDREMHFPHVRLAAGKVIVYEKAGNNPMDLFERLKAEDDWRYSRWVSRELVQHNDQKAHYALRYTRYRSDDSEIGTYDSLYVLLKSEGQWRIAARSSFGP